MALCPTFLALLQMLHQAVCMAVLPHECGGQDGFAILFDNGLYLHVCAVSLAPKLQPSLPQTCDWFLGI